MKTSCRQNRFLSLPLSFSLSLEKKSEFRLMLLDLNKCKNKNKSKSKNKNKNKSKNKSKREFLNQRTLRNWPILARMKSLCSGNSTHCKLQLDGSIKLAFLCFLFSALLCFSLFSDLFCF